MNAPYDHGHPHDHLCLSQQEYVMDGRIITLSSCTCDIIAQVRAEYGDHE